jgi:hypothetical protein
VIGVIAHPVQGAWKGMQKKWAKNQEQSQRTTRISDGVEEFKNSTMEDKERIMAMWVAMKKTKKQRRKKYREEAEKVMYKDKIANPTKSKLLPCHHPVNLTSMAYLSL